MKIRFHLAAVALVFGCAGVLSAAPTDVNKVLDEFVAAASANPAISADQKRVVGELVKQLRANPDDRAVAITESLRVLHPEYKDALAALGQGVCGVSEFRRRSEAIAYS